jgi:hypothetical protein
MEQPYQPYILEGNLIPLQKISLGKKIMQPNRETKLHETSLKRRLWRTLPLNLQIWQTKMV